MPIDFPQLYNIGFGVNYSAFDYIVCGWKFQFYFYFDLGIMYEKHEFLSMKVLKKYFTSFIDFESENAACKSGIYI